MREIKFRAWDGERILNRTLFDRNWYTHDNKCVRQAMPNDSRTLKVMQYTGLKDANGVEIYEGDLLDSNIFICPVSVAYWGDLAMFRLEAQGDDCGDFIEYRGDMFIVIGNIYENPELLK